MNEIYHQMTLDEWVASKNRIREMIRKAKTAFIVIGYELRKIEESEAYRNDGYSTLAEFTKAEYGFDKTMTSRLIDVNKAFSEGGYSDILIDNAEGFTFTKLVEMKDLEQEDLQLLRPEVKREDIRQLKSFEGSAPEEGDLDELLIEFFRKEKETLNEIFIGFRNGKVQDAEEIAELISPSGNRAFRKGMWMAFFYSDKALFKNRAGGIREMSYEDLFVEMSRIFGDAAAARDDPWEAFYGEPEEPAPKAEESVSEPEKSVSETGKIVTETEKSVSETGKSVTETEKSAAEPEKVSTEEAEDRAKEETEDVSGIDQGTNIAPQGTDIEPDEDEKGVEQNVRKEDCRGDDLGTGEEVCVCAAGDSEAGDRAPSAEASGDGDGRAGDGESTEPERAEAVAPAQLGDAGTGSGGGKREADVLAERIDQTVEKLTTDIGLGRYADALERAERLCKDLRTIVKVIGEE